MLSLTHPGLRQQRLRHHISQSNSKLSRQAASRNMKSSPPAHHLPRKSAATSKSNPHPMSLLRDSRPGPTKKARTQPTCSFERQRGACLLVFDWLGRTWNSNAHPSSHGNHFQPVRACLLVLLLRVDSSCELTQHCCLACRLTLSCVLSDKQGCVCAAASPTRRIHTST